MGMKYENSPEIELNADITVGAEAGNVINVGIQLEDWLNQSELGERAKIFAYLSDDVNGDSIAGTVPDSVAIGTDGLMIPLGTILTDALLAIGTLAIWTTTDQFKTTTIANYLISGLEYNKAAETGLEFSAADTINVGTAAGDYWGIWLVQVNAAGTISTKSPSSDQVYASEALALAAKPAVDAGNIELGYIIVEANTDLAWTANTDDLVAASDCQAVSFNDATPVQVEIPKAFHLISEVDGDIDINIGEDGVDTWYLVLVMPNGRLVVSGAITFA